MNPLHQFYTDEHMREAVKNFLVTELEETTVERVFDKKDIIGIYEAKELIEKSFDKLDNLYGKKDNVIITSPR